MAVITEGEILFNGTYFPIDGFVRKSLRNKPPLKFLNVVNQTGGIGRLEMKKPRHVNECWWSTLNLDHEGHGVPQAPVTAATNSPISKISPYTHTDVGSVWTDDAKAYDADLTTFAYAVGAVGWSGFLALTVPSTNICGIAIKIGRGDAAVDQVDIDYYDGSWHDVFSGAITANMMAGLYTWPVIATAVTQIRISFHGDSVQIGRVYEAYVLSVAGTITKLTTCDFNSNTYFGINTILAKVNSTTGVIEPVYAFASNITGLVSKVDSSMAILLGDSTALWWMTAAGVFTETDETGATYGVHWSNRFNWINSTGTQLSYCTAFAAALAETDNGTIPQKVTMQGLDTYQDAAGTSIIYARTTTGVWAHDTATPKFYPINVQLASHTNTAKAGIVGNGYYISQGYHIVNYKTGGYTAVVDESIGLDAKGGIPSEYNAHIVAFIKGVGCFYALYDATAIGTSGYSWVGKYDEVTGAWSVMWANGTANKNMHSGILSDVKARRLWWDCGNVIYYMPIPTTLLFPKLDSTSTYATSAVHISPIIEGDASTSTKTMNELISYAKGVTTTETIAIKYRLNRTNTDVGTGWTTLVTLNTTAQAGRVATALASGAGVACNAFQYRLDFTNSGASTATADLQNLSISYFDNIDAKYQFYVVIVMQEGMYKNKSLKERETALNTALESQTLLAFQYNAEADTYYVKVEPGDQKTGTGYNKDGRVSLSLIEA